MTIEILKKDGSKIELTESDIDSFSFSEGRASIYNSGNGNESIFILDHVLTEEDRKPLKTEDGKNSFCIGKGYSCALSSLIKTMETIIK